MKPLSITHINFSDNTGGAATIMNDLIHAQLNAGHNPVRCCARPSHHKTQLLGFGKGPKASLGLKAFNKISTLRNRVFGDTYGFCENTYYRILVKTYADIFHIHNIHGGWFPLKLISRLSRIAPIVWTLHDEWAYTGHCVYTYSCLRWLNGCGKCPDLDKMVKIWRDTSARNHSNRAMMYNMLPPQSSAVVAVSNWIALRVKTSSIWPGIVKTIPNGINLNHFYPVPKLEARKRLGIDHNSNVIICCAAGGTDNPFKNTELAIETFKYIPDSKKSILIVIGGGSKQIDTTKNNKSIFFTGYIKNRDLLRDYYAAGDLLVYPTKADTFGLIAAEAMASGTPVLANKTGGITDVIIDGENGFLLPENASPAEISAKICQLLDDHKMLEKMRQRGIQHITENFSVAQMAQRYLSLYRNLIMVK